jgi:hypothetical protein
MMQLTVASWLDVQNGCDAYAAIVGGSITSPSNSMLATARFTAKQALSNVDQVTFLPIEEPPPAYKAFEMQPLSARIPLERDAQTQILEFLSAPDVVVEGLRKAELLECAATWLQTAPALR